MKLTSLKTLLIASTTLTMTGCGNFWDRSSSDDPIPPTEIPLVDGEQEGEGVETDEDGLNLISILGADDRFSSFMDLVNEAGLGDLISRSEYTIFAPTNTAFEQLDGEMLDELRDDETRLRELIYFHLVEGTISAEVLAGSDTLRTANDLVLELRAEDDRVYVNNAELISVDQVAANGIIHGIDHVLLPSTIYTISQLAEINPELSSFYEAVQAADLGDQLAGEGPYTIFAPNNAAFSSLGEGELEALLERPDDLREILDYHLVPGRYDASTLSELDQIVASSDQIVNLEYREDGELYVNGYRVVAQDIKGLNGIIHIINGVLDPAQADDAIDVDEQGPSVFQLTQDQGSLNIFTEALQNTGLAAALGQQGPYTVFAPSDEAFEALDPGFLDTLLANPDELEKILRYHIVTDRLMAGDLAARDQIDTWFAGRQVTLSSNEEGEIFINEARVTESDKVARNGVVHVIDRILIPLEPTGPNVIEVLSQQGFTSFVSLLEEANLTDLIKSNGPYTVFAPSNSAIEDLGEEALEELRQDSAKLEQILRYHFVRNQLLAEQVLESSELRTLAMGRLLRISSNEAGDVLVNEAQVLRTDIEAGNGVIHEIDKILVPGEDDLPSVLDLAREFPQYSRFMEIIDAAGLADALLADGPITIFAPTNRALSHIPEQSLQGLMGSPELIDTILRYHIIDGSVTAEDLVGDKRVATQLPGHSLIITDRGEGEVYVNSALLVEKNLEARNGMFHGIDRLLVPRRTEIPEIPGAPVAPEESTEELDEEVVDSDVDESTVERNLLESIQANERLSTFVALVQQSELLSVILSSENDLTVLAPSDEAFAALPHETLNALLEDVQLLEMVMANHIVAGVYDRETVMNSDWLTSLQGDQLVVELAENDRTYIAGAELEIPDNRAENGIYHVIDAVIIPSLLR